MDPRSWTAFKRQARHVRLPRLHPGEAEAIHQADHARRQADQEHQRVQLAADLAAQRALVDAGIEPVLPPSETSLGGFIDQQF
jgi:hypothetical protein